MAFLSCLPFLFLVGQTQFSDFIIFIPYNNWVGKYLVVRFMLMLMLLIEKIETYNKFSTLGSKALGGSCIWVVYIFVFHSLNTVFHSRLFNWDLLSLLITISKVYCLYKCVSYLLSCFNLVLLLRFIRYKNWWIYHGH